MDRKKWRGPAAFAAAALIASGVACATSGGLNWDMLNPHPLTGYSGTTGFIALREFSPKRLRFEIRVPFRMYLYHVVTTNRGASQEEILGVEWANSSVGSAYTVEIEAGEGRSFDEIGTFYLFIGDVSVTSSLFYPDNYRWFYQYDFSAQSLKPEKERDRSRR